MILTAPHDSDWDEIAALTGDASWQRDGDAAAISRRSRTCRYQPVWHALSRLGLDPTGHGWDGWLPTERAMPLAGARGSAAVGSAVTESAIAALHGSSRLVRALRRLLQSRLDPNDRRLLRRNADGLCFTPLSHQPTPTDGNARTPARCRGAPSGPAADRAACAGDTGDVRCGNRAVGVEYLKGERLYRAHPGASGSARRTTRRSRSTRGDPGRRRVQHAATVDAVRHRSA